MSQLTFKFPFITSYFERDFYVSSNNFQAYRLIENWPNWPSKNINIFGPAGCGKTHLSIILKKKIDSFLIDSEKIDEKVLLNVKKKECIIIDNYQNNIQEKLLYTILNEITQNNKFILINSYIPIKQTPVNLNDLKSRLESFTNVGIDLPPDDLLRVIISKSFSDKQIKLDLKLLEYIIKNIDRSYEKVNKFIKDIDMVSLSSGKSININLIKKVLKNE